jgi:hypothetical protein
VEFEIRTPKDLTIVADGASSPPSSSWAFDGVRRSRCRRGPPISPWHAIAGETLLWLKGLETLAERCQIRESA